MEPKKEIKNLIEQILGSKVDLREDAQTPNRKLKQEFTHLISMIEGVWKRQDEIDEFGIDLTIWDDPYFKIIEGFIRFCFDETPSNAILFYIYSRFDKKGNILPFIDSFQKPYFFKNVDDLWDFILYYEEEIMNPE
jgi:hypothetical protein